MSFELKVYGWFAGVVCRRHGRTRSEGSMAGYPAARRALVHTGGLSTRAETVRDPSHMCVGWCRHVTLCDATDMHAVRSWILPCSNFRCDVLNCSNKEDAPSISIGANFIDDWNKWRASLDATLFSLGNESPDQIAAAAVAAALGSESSIETGAENSSFISPAPREEVDEQQRLPRDEL